MTIQRYQKVYSANSTLHAASLQAALEQAGIPVSVVHARNGAYLDLLVPEAWTEQAEQLLYPERPAGEIFFALA